MTYRPKLAWGLFEQARHLMHAKQFRRAQGPAEEAVAIWRDLDVSDDQRTGLAAALNVLQDENNRPRDALPAALESTEIWEQLAGGNSSSGNDVMGLVEAFSNLAAIPHKDTQVVLGLGQEADRIDQLEAAVVLEGVQLVHVAVDQHSPLVAMRPQPAGQRRPRHGRQSSPSTDGRAPTTTSQ